VIVADDQDDVGRAFRSALTAAGSKNENGEETEREYVEVPDATSHGVLSCGKRFTTYDIDLRTAMAFGRCAAILGSP
jgi:hypothetical protein